MMIAMLYRLLVCILVAEAVSELRDVAPPQIINGRDAKPQEFPWQAKLVANSGDGYESHCGGALISNEWVITAAHCIKGYSAEAITVYLGKHYTTRPTEGEIKIDVQEVIPHEEYIIGKFTHRDIGLLKLKQKVDLNENPGVKAIELASSNDLLRAGDNVTLSGWGLFKVKPFPLYSTYTTMNFCGQKYTLSIKDNQRYESSCGVVQVWKPKNAYYMVVASPPKLQKVTVPVLTENYCRTENVNVDEYWCVGNSRQGSCNGDSGGPMVKKIDGKWKLFGVTSYGALGCNTSQQSTKYTKVQSYLEWIRTNMV